jgi:Fur family peroxide stress response transcriptional regulator
MKIRLTKKRKEILDALKNHGGVFSANDLHKKLPKIDLVTIYRNLDLFVKENMIKKVNLSDSEAHYEYQNTPHHHAVCTDCKKVIHFDASDKKIKKALGLEDFDVDEIDLVVRGRCHKD